MNDNQTRGSVSLIASGYEWTCPTCDHLNREIEIVEDVECANCGAQYNVDIANHAY